MGRFYITNSVEAFEKARQICGDAGLTENGILDHSDFFGVVYDKRTISVDNYFEFSNGTSIGVCGTVLNEKGIDNKTTAFKIAHSNELNNIRNEVSGHYSLIRVDENKVNICVDQLATYNVYYTQMDDIWSISNDLSLIGRTIDQVEINGEGLMERFLFKSNITPRTPFVNVRRLDGYEKLVANPERLELIPINPKREPFEFDSFNGAVNKYSDRLDCIADRIAKSPHRSGVQLTGGLDSRTVLAGLLANGDSPIAIVGKGGSAIKKSYKNDIKINDQIAKRYNLDQYYLDWDDDPLSRDEKTWEEHFNKYGFNISRHYCNPSIFKEYEGNIDPYPEVLLFGFSAGYFNSKPWEKYGENSSYSFDELIDSDSKLRCPMSCVSNPDSFRKNLKEELNTRNDLDIEHIMSGRDIINTEYKINSWTSTRKVVNFINEFTHVVCPLGISEAITPLYEIPNEYRKNKRFQLAVIYKLNQNILDIPVRTKPKIPKEIYDQEINNLHSTSRSKTRIYLDNIIKKAPDNLEEVVRQLYYRVFNEKELSDRRESQSEIREFYQQKLSRYPISNRISTNEISNSNYVKFFLICYASYNSAKVSKSLEKAK